MRRSPLFRFATRGFSLLEVMVSVAILGLAVTVILSAQGGLAATNKGAANQGTAISLGRCRMTEIEEKQLKLGYPRRVKNAGRPVGQPGQQRLAVEAQGKGNHGGGER